LHRRQLRQSHHLVAELIAEGVPKPLLNVPKRCEPSQISPVSLTEAAKKDFAGEIAVVTRGCSGVGRSSSAQFTFMPNRTANLLRCIKPAAA
jgi:hypothetical protein